MLKNEIMAHCRLCLVKDDVNIAIFDNLQEICQKISSCLPVKVSKDDKLPKKICDGCNLKLEQFYEFVTASVQAERQLLEWLKDEASASSKADVRVKEELFEQQNAFEETVQAEYVDFKTKHTEDSAKEPPRKRARKAAVKVKPTLSQETDEEDDDLDTVAKVEDESADNSEQEESYEEVPGTSADDQPGPSGLSKGESEAPWDEDESAKFQCGVCSAVFPSKEKFLDHHTHLLGDTFTCCKCESTFNSCTDLYQHYDSHKGDDGEQDESLVEEIVLSCEDGTEIPQGISDANELLYILDDSYCVNEVVIEENDHPGMQGQSEARKIVKQAVDIKDHKVSIVNLEHGYMLPRLAAQEDFEEEHELSQEIDEDMEGETVFEEEDGNKIVIKTPFACAKTIQTKRFYSPTRPRTQQPKRRHELPDFSSSNYAFIPANETIAMSHYKCMRCEQLFINKFGFYRHVEKGKCFTNNCDVCSATFTRNGDFYEHYLNEHTDRAICNFCFRTFMYEKNVKSHMLRHLDQFSHRCEGCNKGFYTVREYRNHYKNRHMGIRYKCTICTRSFADEYYFKRHIATHSKATVIQLAEDQ